MGGIIRYIIGASVTNTRNPSGENSGSRTAGPTTPVATDDIHDV